MVKIVRVATSWWVASAVMLVLAVKIAAASWPGSWYLTVDRLFVPPQIEDDPIVLAWERTVHRQFVGEWTMRIMRRSGTRFSPFCEADGAGPYVPGSTAPEVATLGWFSRGKCVFLPAGDYQILIAIEARGWPYPAVIYGASNHFTIAERQ